MLSKFKLGFPLAQRMSKAWVYVSMIVLSLVLLEERPGLSMQLLSIENLSLAAEVTVVLLLLSFAWPQKNRTEQNISSESGESISWEPAKFFFLQNWTHRGLYLNLWRKQLQSQPANSAKKPFQPPIIEDDDHSKIPAPWQDRLTQLLNRQGFDAIFSAWLSIDGQHRGTSCVSMISLSNYSDLTTSHGAMVTEQAVQRIGKQLSADVSNDSLVARYLPDRFVVLHFAATSATCQKAMSLFHERTLDKAFFQTAGEPLHLTCNVSVVGLEGRRDLNGTMDLLEEGIVEGGRRGKSIVSHEDNNWIETPVGLEKASPKAQPKIIDSHSNSSTTNSSDSGASDHEKAHDVSVADLSNDKSSTEPLDGEDAQSASNDISAVASPDDIAALFAQINTQKSNTTAKVPSSLGNLEKQPEPKAAINAPTEDSSDAASSDDIAALFATVKPNVKSPEPPTTPAKTPAPEFAEIDKTEAASADDIAALFASVKPSANATKTTTPPTSSTDTKPKPIETAEPEVDVDPSEAATADDIAALFATVKPSKATQAATPTATPVTNKTETLETAKPFAPADPAVDPSEAASADDIAALFATVKPTAKPPVVTTPSKTVELSDVDRAEPATADDIAALFATVKSAVNLETPSKQSKPTTASTPTPASPIPTGEELSQAATPDDIASLLASIKPVAPAPIQPTKALELAAPIIPTGEELSESASADDIAALFASVKPTAQSNSAKQTTSAPTAPSHSTKASEPAAPVIPAGEELSETASADDIAALFAAVKPTAQSNSAKQSAPVAPAPSQPTKTPEPAAPAVPTGEQLSETASADDIAALFATVKPAAQSKPAKQTTAVAPGSVATKTTAQTHPIPEEELSANASLDDIEALFAAMKK